MTQHYDAVIADLRAKHAALGELIVALENARRLTTPLETAAVMPVPVERPAPKPRTGKRAGVIESLPDFEVRVVNMLETATEPLKATEVADLLKASPVVTLATLMALVKTGTVRRVGRGGVRFVMARKEAL